MGGSRWLLCCVMHRVYSETEAFHFERLRGTGWTALHSAAEAGKSAAVALLLKNGASAAARARHGWTPLHLACMRGKSHAAKVLLAGGADANTRSRDQVGTEERPSGFLRSLKFALCSWLLSAGWRDRASRRISYGSTNVSRREPCICCTYNQAIPGCITFQGAIHGFLYLTFNAG